MTAYQTLFNLYKEIHPLEQFRSLANWDGRVNLPFGAVESRQMMVKSLNDVIDAKRKAVLTKDMITQAATEKLNEWDERNLYLIQSDFRAKTLVPDQLRNDLRLACNQGQNIWAKAKQNNDWSMMQPVFEKIVQLRREKNKLLLERADQSLYEVSLINYIRGYTLAELNQLLDRLAEKLSPIVKQRSAQTPPKLPEIKLEKQLQICKIILSGLGYDFNRGQINLSEKAFHTAMDNDSRIAVRADIANIWGTISSAVHEMGHALHGFGVPKEFNEQPVGSSGDYASREAMAFIWQVHVLSKPEIIRYISTVIKQETGIEISSEEFEAVINFHSRGPIRIGADNSSYILHIVIRTKIEQALLNGELEVADLPKRWAELYDQYLGVEVPNDAQGCLQDIHWYKGSFGYFPAYAVAHLYSAVLMEKAESDLPSLSADLAQGNGRALISWLEEHIYRFANLHPGRTLIRQTIGRDVDVNEFVKTAI
jgi:carboxypeptidase Taq